MMMLCVQQQYAIVRGILNSIFILYIVKGPRNATKKCLLVFDLA